MEPIPSLPPFLRTVLLGLIILDACRISGGGGQLAPGVRGLATRAPKNIKIDGDLSEFKNAFCTPVEYHNENLRNRAAQFFYMWDEEAFYAGLRTLDTQAGNFAPNDRLWEGDGVEWYFDTRRGAEFRSQGWPTNQSPGAVHCYWVGLNGTNVQGRFCLRPGFLNAIKKIGVEVGARRTAVGMDVEFKLPWANFPEFQPALNEVIALDAELCYGDGDADPKKWRVARSFAYGSPLSVQQPANLGLVQLVDAIEPEHWKACGPVMMPIRCDTAWTQNTPPLVTGYLAIPSNQANQIGNVAFRLLRLDGSKIADFPGRIETFETQGNFQRAVAHWPGDLAAPGAYMLLGIVYGKRGEELTRVTPRLVSVGMTPGY